MKAIIHTRYGPPEVLQLAEVEKPTHSAPRLSASGNEGLLVLRLEHTFNT